MAMKICARCSTFKLFSDFSRCAGNRDGLQGYCRECAAAYAKTPQMKAARAMYRQVHAAKIRAQERAGYRARKQATADTGSGQ